MAVRRINGSDDSPAVRRKHVDCKTCMWVHKCLLILQQVLLIVFRKRSNGEWRWRV